MKTAIGVVLGVIMGVAIITVVTIVLLFNVFNASSRSSSVQTPPGTPVQTQAPSPVVSLVPAPVPPVSLPPSSHAPSNSNVTIAQPTVEFNLNITGIENTGLTSRGVTGQITNAGTVDAHNVSAKVQVFCQGSLVKINNQDYIVQSLGAIKAGNTVTQAISLSFSILDVGRLSQNGATVTLTITSDEKTQTFSYNFQP
jgi:hypothetical protein